MTPHHLNLLKQNRPGAVVILIGLALLAACSGQRGQRVEDLPTPASIEGLATAQFLTANAPPPGFEGPLALPEVDANLTALPGWRYVVELAFDGVFAGTPRQTAATAQAEIWYRQLGAARRVVVSTSGELLGRQDSAFEAVRLAEDAFLVREGACSGGPDAATAADLRAGMLVGGVNRATFAGKRATLNGEEAWLYTFSTADLNLPSVRLSDEGSITLTGGELWFAPARNAVIRFYVNLDVNNAIIFDRQLPVSGQLLLRYDLYDIGLESNITVPFGC